MNYTDFTYDEAHNLKIRLRMPEGVENPPLFIYIHGGGITGGSYTDHKEALEELTRDGIATASIDYRLYPNAKYPEFIEDSAAAVAYMKNLADCSFSDIFVGGSSAGSYLSMMLFFDPKYLGAHGIDPMSLGGYVFDAGQPTVHYNVLRERGMDSRLLRVDEAAPIYHITKDYDTSKHLPKIVRIAGHQVPPPAGAAPARDHAPLRLSGHPQQVLLHERLQPLPIQQHPRLRGAGRIDHQVKNPRTENPCGNFYTTWNR